VKFCAFVSLRRKKNSKLKNSCIRGNYQHATSLLGDIAEKDEIQNSKFKIQKNCFLVDIAEKNKIQPS
jgi:hypothetical protein